MADPLKPGEMVNWPHTSSRGGSITVSMRRGRVVRLPVKRGSVAICKYRGKEWYVPIADITRDEEPNALTKAVMDG